MTVKVAVVQKPPVLLDLAATMARALESLAEAAAAGSKLVIFPEAYRPRLPGVDLAAAARRRHGLTERIACAAARRTPSIWTQATSTPLCEGARKHGLIVVCGMSEVDSGFSGSTLYNTVVTIGPDGTILNRHRKLMPTNPERMVWGPGDGSGLKVVDTPSGRIGTLICWESYMPLARYALYAQNIEIYVAPTWDCGEIWLATMRHIAREGGCWVIGLATALQGKDVPDNFPSRDALFKPDDWLCDGDAVIVEPSGKILAGPLHREKGILYGDVDPAKASRARRSLDVTGHYARPDIFRLDVKRSPMPPVEFT